jgi:hypothetical protein
MFSSAREFLRRTRGSAPQQTASGYQKEVPFPDSCAYVVEDVGEVELLRNTNPQRKKSGGVVVKKKKVVAF